MTNSIYPEPEETDTVEELSALIPEDYLDFWLEALLAIQEYQGDPQVIFPLLEANSDKLDDHFVELPRYWVRVALPKLTLQQAIIVAGLIADFSDLMQQFSPSNREIAIAGYEAALTIFNHQEFPQQWAAVQINLAVAYRNRTRGNLADNIECAIACYQNALQVLNRTTTTSPSTWALAQSNLAVAYIDRLRGERSENLELVIACCQKALSVYNPQEFPLDWAMTCNNLAVAYRTRIVGDRSDNLEAAIAYYQKSLQVYTREKYPQQWATTLSNLGNAYRNRLQGDRADNLEAAISYCEQALQVLSANNSAIDWARTQHYLGSAYRERVWGEPEENLERAIACYQAALQIYNPDTLLRDWALVQNDLALAYKNRLRGEPAENLEQAIACCERVLEVLTLDAFPEQAARTLNTLGIAYRQRLRGDTEENMERAIACYRRALQVYRYDTLPEQWARTHNNLGIALSERHQGERQCNLEEAIASYQQALRIYTLTIFPENYVKTQCNLGLAYRDVGQLYDAVTAFRAAIDGVELLRSQTLSGDTIKQKLAERWSQLYQQAVEVCLDLATAESHYYSQALEYVERSKARNLVELLSVQELLPKGEIPATVIQELQTLRRALAAEQRSQRHSETGDYRRFYELRQQLDRLLANQIQPLDPTFGATQKVEAIPFAQMRALLSKDTVAIAWYVTDDYFLTFVITSESPTPQVWRSAAGDREALKDWVNSYFQAYLQKKTTWQERLIVQLYDLAIILNLEKILNAIPKTCSQAILIPHRFLHLLPLHALPIVNREETLPADLPRLDASEVEPLPDREVTAILLDRFSSGVRYAPSFQILQLIQNQHRSAFSRFLAVQNPTLDLSYTDLEVETISRDFQPQVDILAGKSARKELLLERLSLAHCVHFSCHAYFDFQSPLKSALVLAGGVKETAAVGEIDWEKCLTLGEIFALDLSECRLAMLSACETGFTDFRSISDEYVGLPSSFLFAGCIYVVSSLWTINDLSAAFLMIKFYQNLQNGLAVTFALNQSQLWLKDLTKGDLERWIEENQLPLKPAIRMNLRRRLYKLEDDAKPFKSPFYWAAFCGIGQ
ncbi:CHAT domain-containing tetratricopeptide repeat protein [Microcoleus sp. Z1_C3]|uniref:CHAT domain-containing tetratricopeptide repeat protein n=1 Tax=unclassified Microcoleus TaxID=2642155 RepID=UPI002FD638CE